MRYRHLLCCLLIMCAQLAHGLQVERSLLRVPAAESSTLADVISSSRWQPIAEFGNHGFSEDVFWLRLEIRLAPGEEKQKRILKLAYPLHDEVDIYRMALGSVQQHWVMGDARVGAQWVYPTKYFAVPFDVRTDEVTRLFVRIKGHNSKVLKTSVLTEEDFQREVLIRNVLAGAFFGMLLIMGLYNLSLAFLVRDKSYFIYVAYVALFGYLALALTGDGRYLLWHNSPEFNHYAISLAGGLLAFPTIFFPYYLLNVPLNAPHLKKYFFMAAACALSYVVALPFLNLELGLKLINLINIVTTLFLLGAGIYLAIKKVPVAWIYTLAWSFIITGLVVLSLAAYNVLPMNDLTSHANLIGGLIEMVLLSFALAQRIHVERKGKMQALQQVACKEQEVVEQRKLYQDLFEHAPVGIFSVDHEGRLAAANPEFCRMLGYDNRDAAMAAGDQFRYLFSNHAELEKEVFRQGRVLDHETILTPAQGQERICSVSLRARKRGTQMQVEGYLTDITERKTAEKIRDIMERERMASLEQLVTGIAHEINTPLGVNITSVSCISDELRDVNQQMEAGVLKKTRMQSFIETTRDAITIVEDNLKHISQLVKRFKLISVQQAHSQKQQFDLAQYVPALLRSTLESFDQIELDVQCDGDLTLEMDPTLWNVVFEQLVENSLVHGFANSGSGTIQVSLTAKDGEICVNYADNGQGVSSALRQTLFNPFVTSRRGHKDNAGLGLYRVYNLVTQVLKGELSLLEQPGFALQIRFQKP